MEINNNIGTFQQNEPHSENYILNDVKFRNREDREIWYLVVNKAGKENKCWNCHVLPRPRTSWRRRRDRVWRARPACSRLSGLCAFRPLSKWSSSSQTSSRTRQWKQKRWVTRSERSRAQNRTGHKSLRRQRSLSTFLRQIDRGKTLGRVGPPPSHRRR